MPVSLLVGDAQTMSPRTSGTSPRTGSAPINKCRASSTAMTSNGLRQTQTARSSSWAQGDLEKSEIMSVRLQELTEKLHQDCLALSPDQDGNLKNLVNLGNTYVELVTQYINHYSEGHQSVLQTVTDEFFVDIHVSVILAAGGYYKSGCVTLRAAIELGIYILYFIDHPVELRMWASSGESEKENDMYFSQILEKIANVEYLIAASGNDVNSRNIIDAKTNLRNDYRLLSERVHGKFKFLQASSSDPDDIFTIFCKTAEETLQNLIKLGIERAGANIDLERLIPSLERLI